MHTRYTAHIYVCMTTTLVSLSREINSTNQSGITSNILRTVKYQKGVDGENLIRCLEKPRWKMATYSFACTALKKLRKFRRRHILLRKGDNTIWTKYRTIYGTLMHASTSEIHAWIPRQSGKVTCGNIPRHDNKTVCITTR